MTVTHSALSSPRPLSFNIEIHIASTGSIIDPGTQQPDTAVLAVSRL